jgi:hypothetical protein
MKKPEDNIENIGKCICGQCPLYTECTREKLEGLYCARTKSECELDNKKMCICGGCKVFQENNLFGGYFCINEIKEEE